MPISSLLTAPIFALLMLLGNFNWQFSPQTDSDGTAWVKLTADEPLNSVEVEITGSDGSKITKTVNIKPGKPTKITWKQEDRQVAYDLSIEASNAYTDGSFEIQRPIAGGKRGPFKLLSDRTDIVDRQTIKYRTPFTISSRELQVFNTDGDVIIEELVTDEIVEAGSTFEMSWNTSDEVFMIKVTGADDTGFSYTDSRVPWSIDIPHSEVTFDSGKAIIKPDQEAKVAETFAILAHELAGLDKANKAVNEDLAAQLYIVGYTDTVGNAGDNAKLSEARAKAIAKYFYDKGAWCEIYYAGMGERGLAVATGDSVDEVRNRRALYILGMEKPAGGGQVPGPGRWKKLSDARTRMIQNLPPLPDSYIKYKEEQQRKRDEKYGRGGSGGGSGDGSGDGSGGDGDADSDIGDDSGSDSSDFESSDRSGDSGGSGNDDGPPAIEGEVGGAKQGCATVEPSGAGSLGVLAGLFGLLGLRRRRRAS